MSYIKKLSMLLPLTVLAGCVTVAGDSNLPKQATGSEAGKLVVFASENLGGETVGISLNNQFMAPLQANKQFTQSLCSGAYQMEAHSVNARTAGKNAKRVVGEQFVQVVPQQTTYVEVSRANNSWIFQEVSEEEWQQKSAMLIAGESDKGTKIVRRLTPAMVNCK